MGCGCGKRNAAATQRVNAQRATTVYQVLKEGSVDSEYGSLPEARQHAIKVGGRVKVTSKIGS